MFGINIEGDLVALTVRHNPNLINLIINEK
jgi:hypothetical protein